MYDKEPQVFTVNKNDAQYLDDFQINKAKYWFQKFIGKFFFSFSYNSTFFFSLSQIFTTMASYLGVISNFN